MLNVTKQNDLTFQNRRNLTSFTSIDINILSRVKLKKLYYAKTSINYQPLDTLTMGSLVKV